MSITNTETRDNRVLEAIIDAYVASATPVGSALVAKKLRSSLSSATIRNIMVELEQQGLLEQPHTSAGRVPTDKGYRRYVKLLMDVGWLSQEQVEALEQQIIPEEREVELLLERATTILADVAQQAAFVVTPTVKQGLVRRVELVPLSARRILCILVSTHEEMYASHVVEVEEPLTRDEAMALVRFINTELVGQPFGDLVASLERRLLAERDSLYHIVRRSLEILEHALSTEPENRMILEGRSYVVAQPEFKRDPQMAEKWIRSLESQAPLLERMKEDLGTERVTVRIGSEVPLGECDECSYVIAPFLVDGTVAGGVGVLGPKRMDYRRMSAWVDGMARSLADLLNSRRAS